MEKTIALFLVIFIPVFGSFLLPILGNISLRLRNLSALIMVLSSLAFSFLVASFINSGEAVFFTKYLPLGFNFSLRADILAVFMAVVSALISAVIVLFSFDYISHYQNQNEYYSMVVLFLGAMMGIVFSANLVLLYIFWEITAITSWRLIGFFRQKEQVIKADKAFLVTVFGSLAMLMGFIMIFQQCGSFELSVIKKVLAKQPLANPAVILILCGIFSKSATLPFHTWLPDAGVAPSPVTALLHAAVLVKIGVYVYARLFLATFTYDAFFHTFIPAVAAISALVSAGAALLETDLKRIIAYSTVSQIAFIFLGLSIGNTIGAAGAILYILMHGLAKGGLFLCAGIIEQNTKTKDITKLGGLIHTMPLTAFSFLFCAFSVMGIPPFGGFFSKYMVMSGAFLSGQLTVSFLFLAGAVVTILYLLRVFRMVFLGEVKSTAREGSFVMVASVSMLALASLAAGIFIRYPNSVVELLIKQFIG